jgi:AraC-like DNA-binding protein
MPLLKYFPGTELRDVIELFWYNTSESQASLTSAGAKEAILPDGCGHLVINLSENRICLFERLESPRLTTFGGSIFCGPRSSPYGVLSVSSAVIGVVFRPAGIARFLNAPTEEFANYQLPLERIFGSEAEDLRHSLIEACSPASKFILLEQSLIQRQRTSALLHRAVKYAIHALEHDISVTQVLARVGLSERRFSRIFSEQVGMTPKLFYRVRRFQRAIALLPFQEEIDWARTALDTGYYDQAHFIHEFRTFSSVTPTAYVASGIAQRNHLPLRS